MTSLKIIEIGKELGVILPSDVLAKFKDMKNDTLYLTRTQDGILLTASDPIIQFGEEKKPNPT